MSCTASAESHCNPQSSCRQLLKPIITQLSLRVPELSEDGTCPTSWSLDGEWPLRQRDSVPNLKKSVPNLRLSGNVECRARTAGSHMPTPQVTTTIQLRRAVASVARCEPTDSDLLEPLHCNPGSGCLRDPSRPARAAGLGRVPTGRRGSPRRRGRIPGRVPRPRPQSRDHQARANSSLTGSTASLARSPEKRAPWPTADVRVRSR